MIHGTTGDVVIIIENVAGSEYNHVVECSQVGTSDPNNDYRYECTDNYIDAHCYKTIFVKKDLREIKE